MSKIRVYELAKELNISSKDLIELLMDEFNIEVKNHMSVIEDEDAELIKELLGNQDSETKSEVIEEYDLLIKVTYDENGEANVEFKSGNETSGAYMDTDMISNLESEELGYKYEPIKNMTFIYGIEDIVTSEFNQTYLYNQLNYKYEEMVYRYIWGGIILVVLFGLVIPYRKEKDIFMMKRLIKAPLDIKVVLIIFNIIMCIYSAWIAVETISGLVSGGLYLRVGDYEVSVIITIISNILIFLVAYITLFYNVVLVKSIKKGRK